MNTADGFIQQGDQLFERHKFDLAEHTYRRATVVQPENAQAHFLLGAAMTWRDALREAEPEFRVAVRCDPENAEYHDALGGVLFKDFRFPQAEAEFREAVRLQTKPRYTLHLATALEARDEYSDATKQWGKAEDGYRKRYDQKATADALLGLAKALSGQQKWDEASEMVRDSIGKLGADADLPEVHRALGDVLLGAQQYEDAERSYRISLGIQPNAPMKAIVHNALGITLFRLERYPDAEAELRQAIALAKDWHDPYVNLGQVLAARSSYEDAESSLREAIKLQSRNPAAYRNLAEVLRRQGRLEQGLEQVQRGLFRDRADWYAWDTLAVIYLDIADRYHDSGVYRDAVEACTEALASKRYKRYSKSREQIDAALVYLHRGYAYVGLKEFGKAARDFKAGVDQAEPYSGVHFSAKANLRRINMNLKKEREDRVRLVCIALLALAAGLFGAVRTVQGEFGAAEFVSLASVTFVAVVAAFFLPELTKLKLGPAEMSKEASAAPPGELPPRQLLEGPRI
jgi:tetratricopeptide (TPR) repeat protein